MRRPRQGPEALRRIRGRRATTERGGKAGRFLFHGLFPPQDASSLSHGTGGTEPQRQRRPPPPGAGARPTARRGEGAEHFGGGGRRWRGRLWRARNSTQIMTRLGGPSR
ncbi:hypothetical protein TDIS_0948 [Thermosulfurimonas dismutans]|uniref:Uncharacterized protein n=1 Tax=Thermosulfurimonas dismutans TaxID=999894 RepID=A0A179D6E8_9BACT|nr:hypothetical protein TDIS_0948 [Thermosulfurimonas dismutans]